MITAYCAGMLTGRVQERRRFKGISARTLLPVWSRRA